MDIIVFSEALKIIEDNLQQIGTTILNNIFDGILVKELQDSNTLADDRTSHQTHIAVTGQQMDMFPYLRSDGYFNHNEEKLKKYFILQIPVKIYESNIKYLRSGALDETIFTNGIRNTSTSVIRSKRNNQSDQIQVSLITFDGHDFINFRKLLHKGSYLIILKLKGKFEYDIFGIKKEDVSSELQSLNNLFLKEETNTLINIETLASEYFDYTDRVKGGTNILLYGVPGSGKSWTIEHEYCNGDSIVDRVVFHPDYTNADFVGQILPVVDENKQITYEFTPGPFTTILCNAYHNPMRKYILIIEEINRGNAPAIFGEIFQLLDRKVEIQENDDGFPVGTSEYGITHKYIAEFVYGNMEHKVRIPSNLYIVGTMNTSDQNVFTLDTAFQRRWRMRLIENTFNNVRMSLAKAKILDTGVTWKRFVETVNAIIVGNKTKMASAEDKRLGVYFVHENDLKFDQRSLPSADYPSLLDEYNILLGFERSDSINPEQKSRLMEIREAVMNNRLFPEKVIKYLWDDAFKFNSEALFDTDMDNLEKVIRTFVYSTGQDRFKIFKQSVRDTLYTAQQL